MGIYEATRRYLQYLRAESPYIPNNHTSVTSTSISTFVATPTASSASSVFAVERSRRGANIQAAECSLRSGALPLSLFSL